MKRITVLVADDHTVVRQGFRSLLEHEKGIDVVGEADNGRQAVEMAKVLKPSVVVMDLLMPLLNGTEATRQMKQLLPSPQIIILSAYGGDAHIEQVVAAGASGYLMKMTSAKNLARAIREVSEGKTFFDSCDAKRIHSQYQKSLFGGKFVRPLGSLLTSRELEVLQLVAEGMANKQIANELNISIKTVEKHRHQLKKKLNIQDTAGLTRYAIAEGIIDSEKRV